jgi:plastocyanin domain-containing protein
MSTGLVIAAILAGAVGCAGFCVFWRRRPVRARVGPESVQEVTIVVNGRYQPDRVVVRQGIPVRLRFVRNEDNPCSEWVIFSVFNVRRRLAAYKTTVVSFLPARTGDFLFTCQFGVYRGKLIVRNGHGRKADLKGYGGQI